MSEVSVGEAGGDGAGGNDGLNRSEGGCQMCNGTCNSGRCLITLVQGLYGVPRLLAVGRKSVYFTALYASEYSVMKVPVEGGAPVVIASWKNVPKALVVGLYAIYWTDWDGVVNPSPDAGQAGFAAIPTGGEAPISYASGQSAALRIGDDAINVYWAAYKVRASVMRMPLAGGTPITLASDQKFPGSIVVDATNVYWTNGGVVGRSGSFASLMKIPTGGGTPITLASSDVTAGGSLAIDSGFAYWTISVYSSNQGSITCLGQVMKVPLAGGPTTMLDSSQNCPAGIAVDEAAIYWPNLLPADNGSLMKLPLSGGTTVTLVTGQTLGDEIVVDDRYVYWTTIAENSNNAIIEGQGTVMKTLKN